MRGAQSWRRLAAGLATAALAAGSIALAAPAAHAQAVNLTLTGPSAAAANSTVTVTVSGSFALGSVVLLDQNGTQYGNQAVQIPPPSALSFTFTMPTSPSPLTLTATNYDTGSAPAGFSNSLTINQSSSVQTSTTISAPNTVKVGTGTKITVTVASVGQNYAPTGQVIVRDQNGNTVTTMGLTKQNAGSSYAYWTWTPATAGTYILTAYYQGDGVAQQSTSPADAINATASGNTISLAAPSTVTAGVPVTITATLVPSTIQGSVGFTVNGAPISASIAIQNGQASMSWNPAGAGLVTLGANYTTNGGQTGSTSSQVTIVAGPTQADVITLTQPGYGNWVSGGTYALGNGSQFTFAASTLSGAPVTLSENGPCQVSGLTLTVNQSGGSCQLIAKSTGRNGYGPVTQTYTITTTAGQQTATIAAPPSGRVNKNKTIVLEAPGQQDTNAGQNIVWTVKKSSKKVCKLGFPSNGSVTVKLTKSGQCTVTGSAPGVPGQWAPYKVMRTYTA